MATNIIETIQKNLGLPALEKIDPNSQETKGKSLRSSQDKLAQAAIPAVLAALYKFTRTDEGCQAIISNNDNPDWLGTFFEDREKSAVDKVALYAAVMPGEAESVMVNVADEAINTLKNSIKTKPSVDNIRSFMADQRHNILVYLPAAMQMGDVLNDESMDDRTNKMEGPVSGFMHRIEKMLSKGDESKYP
ncbi:MAG: hypothetical protein ACHQFX_11970 [Chitinophagales bacterium]